jgi:hypothetical protein
MANISTHTGRLDNGVTYYEHHICNFVESKGSIVTSIRFTPQDAKAVGKLLQCFAQASLITVALYPWVEAAWESLSALEWTTMLTKTFVRHRWLGSAGSQRWVIGRAHSEQKLENIIQWAWTLPGRDTLLFIPIASTDVANIWPLATEFRDDQEENGENELRLLKHYPIVASRGVEGRYFRVFSTSLDETALAKCADPIFCA